MKKTTLTHFYNKFIIALLFVIGATVNSFAQCPTITTPTQTFCDTEVPVVANLIATDNGGGIRWYDTSNSSVPISNSVGLIHNKEYFVDDNTGSCGTRQIVKVQIYGMPAALSFQGVCVDSPEDATIARLFANGHDIQWYNQPSGGSPLATTALLIDGTYYVDQSNPDTGCRTSRRAVSVSIGGIVPVPVGHAVQGFCAGENPTLADLVASGNNRWYSTISSGNHLDPSTPLVDGQSYYATTYNFPCESDERLQITVEITQPNNAGSDGEIEICETGTVSTNTINLFEALLGTPETTGIWTGPRATSNNHIGTVDVSSMTLAGSPYIFTYAVSSDSCPTDNATVSIMITESGNPGTDGTLNLCINSPPQNLFTSLEGTPEPGGTWSPALASGSGVFDPLLDTAGSYTYTVYGVPPCGPASATVTVSVSDLPEPGTNGNLILCSNSTPANLFNSLGGSPQSGGTWTPALTSGTGVFDPSQDLEGVYTYTISGPCKDVTSTVTVSINPLPNPGTNGHLLVLCSNDDAADLFEQLGGAPETGGIWSPALASGTGVFDPTKDTAGVYTYTINGISPCGAASATVTVNVNPEAEPGTNANLALCIESAPKNLFDSLGGTPQAGGTWSPALTSGTGIFDPLQDAAGIYTYTVLGIAPCGDATATVTVTVNPLANAGSNGSLVICSSDASANLFDSLGGSPDTGGTWLPALASGSGVFNPKLDTAGIYTYTAKGVSPCGNATATVEVTVNPGVEPGTNGNLALCVDSSPENLFNSLGGTPQSGGTWSPALASGTGVFDPSKDAAGIYTYTILGTAPCGDATATVTVIIDSLLDAGTNGSLILCKNDSTQDLFDSLEGTPVTGGTWSPALASGTGIFDPTQDHAGFYTYTITTNCGQASATVEVIVHPQADPGINGNLTLCIDGNTEDLFSSLGGTPQSGGTWSPALASGTGWFDPSLDTAGTYTYTVSGITPCGTATSTVTVTVDTAPQAGLNGRFAICTNDAPQDLFDSLGGTPETGGTWSPALASGSGVFNPAQDTGGSYTYTVTNACGTDSATVTVALIPQPDITGLTLSASTICLDDALTINLSGATQLVDGNYSLTYSLSGANNTEETISINITNGSTNIVLPASQLTIAGTTTFTILNLFNPLTDCGTASSTIPTVNFNIEQADTPQLVNEGNVFCLEDNATIADLTSNLIGANIVTWYDALENGNAYTADTPLVDGTTYFASNMTISGCSNAVRLAVMVTIDLCKPLEIIIPDGFSPNGDNINDDFLIRNLKELYPNFKLQIYNRYGNILYKGDINTPNWDGTSNQGHGIGSGVLPVGVYYYILELKDTNNKTIQGSVYLNR